MYGYLCYTIRTMEIDINNKQGATQMADYLAPYQIKFTDDEMWLENTETGTTFFRRTSSISHTDYLIATRDKMNSRVGLDRCGV